MRILVVEDHPDVREALVAGLELAGHESQEATMAAEAFAALDSSGVDGARPLEAVICDGMLPFDLGVHPAIWGPEIVEEAQKLGLPAILYTADEDLVDRARREGMTALLKPAGIKEILKALEARRAEVRARG